MATEPAAPKSVKKKSSDLISVPEMKAALLRSGYLLETRVETALRRAGWFVECNSSYVDYETQKSRELDIYAMSLEEVKRNNLEDVVWSILIAECINTPFPLVFLTKRPLYSQYNSDAIRFVCDPAAVPDGDDREQSINSFLQFSNYHHYCRGRSATQYCSFVRKNQSCEWMAKHEDEHFNSFSTLSKAVEYRISELAYSDGAYVSGTFVYPVLIVQGEIYDCRTEGKKIDFRRTNWVQFRKTVTTSTTEIPYVIDVINERALPNYLSVVRSEMRRTAFRIRRNLEILRKHLRPPKQSYTPFFPLRRETQPSDSVKD